MLVKTIENISNENHLLAILILNFFFKIILSLLIIILNVYSFKDNTDII